MDGDGRRQERSHLSGTVGESWPLTVVMDGNSALPSVGLAGCLAQPCTPGWGIPCGASLLFLWLGDQLLAPQDRRLAKGAKPCTHSPREGGAAYGHLGESEVKPWPLTVFFFSSQVLCEATRSQHNFTDGSLGTWHTCALCKRSRLGLSVSPSQLLETPSRSLGCLSGGWEVENIRSSPHPHRSTLSIQEGSLQGPSKAAYSKLLTFCGRLRSWNRALLKGLQVAQSSSVLTSLLSALLPGSETWPVWLVPVLVYVGSIPSAPGVFQRMKSSRCQVMDP